MTDSMVWRHIASDRRMDSKSAHGSMRLGTSYALSDPRPGTGPIARSSSEDFDRWVFTIERRRRALDSKTDVLNDSSATTGTDQRHPRPSCRVWDRRNV